MLAHSHRHRLQHTVSNAGLTPRRDDEVRFLETMDACWEVEICQLKHDFTLCLFALIPALNSDCQIS